MKTKLARLHANFNSLSQNSMLLGRQLDWNERTLAAARSCLDSSISLSRFWAQNYTQLQQKTNDESDKTLFKRRALIYDWAVPAVSDKYRVDKTDSNWIFSAKKLEIHEQRVQVCRDHVSGMTSVHGPRRYTKSSRNILQVTRVCRRSQCKYYHIPIQLPPAVDMTSGLASENDKKFKTCGI